MTTTSIDDRTATGPRAAAPIPGGPAAAVGGALALAAANAVVALTPGMADLETTADVLGIAGDHEGLTEAATVLTMLACLLLVPGVWAVTTRLVPRARRLSAVGGWTMGTGYLFGLVLAFESMIAVSVARAGGDPGVYVAAMDDHTPPTLLATYVLFGLGALVGTVLVGVAALRQRGAVPRWAGWALVVSPVVRMGGLLLGLSAGPPAASLLIAAGFAGILLGRRTP